MKPKKMPKKDVFAGVPEFMAAFDNIAKNGFFEHIQFNVGDQMMEGRIGSCLIRASGYVPSGAAYHAEGCGVLINPQTVIDACRKLADKRKIEAVFTDVKSNDWQLWSKDETEVVGSKGMKTEMFISIIFKS